MIEYFKKLLSLKKLIPKHSRILVGYSGGSDSTCMLHLLNLIGIKVYAAHLDHNLRESSYQESLKCQEFCEKFDIPIIIEKFDIQKFAAEKKIGLEEAGRFARYNFFERIALNKNCDFIATGHTLDDHAETILLHIVRGSGLNGLKGIPYKRGNIIRPILDFTKSQTRMYCLENNLWFHDDASNNDIKFSRCLIRHKVLPELKKLNPNILNALQRLSSNLQCENDFLNDQANLELNKASIQLNYRLSFLTNHLEYAYDRKILISLSSVMFNRVIRIASQKLDIILDYELTHLINEKIHSESKGSLTSEGAKMVIEWNKDLVHFQLLKLGKIDFPLKEVYKTDLWTMKTEKWDPQDFMRERGSFESIIDVNKVVGTLNIRNYRCGDKISPLGLKGHHRKLSDILAEAGLTRIARHSLPIVCDGQGPIWLPSICLSDRVKVDQQTQRAIKMNFLINSF